MVRAENVSGRRALPPDARVVIVARSVNRLGAFSLAFLPTLLTQSFSTGLQTSGLVLSLFGVATVPSRLVGGQLADRWGRRRTMVGGLVGCAAAQLWIASAQSLAAVACAVALLGLVFELYEPPSQALLVDASPPADRPAVFGLLAAGLAGAGMVSGLLAAAIAGTGLRWLFVADAVSCLACAILVQSALPPGRCPPVSAPSAYAVRPWRDRRLLAMTTLGTVFAIIYLQIVFGLPLTLTQRHRPVGDLGLLLALSAATIVSGQALLRRGPIGRLTGFRAMALGYAVLALGSAGMGFARSLPAFALCTVVWSIGDLLLMGHAYALVAALAPENGRGRYLAVYGVSWGLAAMAAPLIGTQLLRGGPPVLWLCCAAGAAVLALAQPFAHRMCVPPSEAAPAVR